MAMLMKLCDNIACFPFPFAFLLQVFDGREKIFNVSSDQATFQLVRLPSDARLTVRVNTK